MIANEISVARGIAKWEYFLKEGQNKETRKHAKDILDGKISKKTNRRGKGLRDKEVGDWKKRETGNIKVKGNILEEKD